ncbi:MAG: response regulator [Bacteroidales bacterium]|nr:response regulator [Bacteroidales bacterium]
MNVFLITDTRSDVELLACLKDKPGFFYKHHLMEGGIHLWEKLAGCSCEIVIISETLLDGSYNDMKRLTDEFPRLAFIVLTDELFEEHIIGHIRKGAQDYLVRKHVDIHSLLKCLQVSYSRSNLRSDLIKARREADEAREAGNRLLSRISHQIRTPLNAISGMSEMLRDTELNSRQRYYLQTIHESGNMLVSLINDLLDFARIEAGKVKIHHKVFRIYDSIRESINAVLPSAIEKKLEIVYHIQTCLPDTMAGDDLRLRQVIMNLLDNAIKFTDHGHVMLKAQCKLINGLPVLHISVEDSGVGIAKHAIPDLFKAYTQADDSSANQGKSIGLGLAICHKLVHLMHGEMQVESEPGVGSVFSFTIPMEECLNQKDTPFAEGILHQKKVLYLTSVTTLDELLKDYCAYWQADLHIKYVHEDYPEMLHLLDEYDLLISQLRPTFKLDLKLIDRVRSFKEIPHILIKNPETAQDQLLVIRKDTVIIPKPLDIYELYEVIDAVLENNASVLNNRPGMLSLNDHMGESHPLEILVAEDNAINQKIIQSVLNRYGYNPKVVVNGKQAVESVKNRPYDVILMDIQMPEMDGIEACRQIRESIGLKPQPAIIALTADALQQSRDEYIVQGFDELLYKPVQTKALMQLISACERIKR